MKRLLLACLVLLPGDAARAAQGPDDALGPESVRIALRAAADDLSRLAMPEEVDLLRELLQRLGDSSDTLDRLAGKWEKNLARKPQSASRKAKLIKTLRRQAGLLADELVQLSEARQIELAEVILELDAEVAAANEVLGRRLHEGRWLADAELELQLGAARVGAFLQEALALEIEVSSVACELPALTSIYTEACTTARSPGWVLHSPLPAPKLERILRQTGRAAALSNAILFGELRLPDRTEDTVVVLLDSVEAYERALDEALASGGITEAEFRDQQASTLGGFHDARGWSTINWCVEAQAEAVLLWLALRDWIGSDAQPCLFAGHLNWLCLNVLGTSMPTVLWQASPGQDTDGRSATQSRAFAAESLWRSSRQCLYGCRSWMVQRVQDGRDPPWSNSMVDQVGRIQNEGLLKTTLVVAYLQESGRLEELLKATRSERTDRVSLFEEALGVQLPEFERDWSSWLTGRRGDTGLVQALEGPPVVEQSNEAHEALIGVLNQVRARALAGQLPEFEAVTEDPELSRGALAHARYLALNEQQMAAWPDAHEEYPGQPGFSPPGARAGLHSVIAPHAEPEEAIDAWMGTFYHRLPLLDPGLFGVGVGIEPEAVVLDSTSLVLEPWREHWVAWPAEGEEDVPRAFVPELPNPVPGKDQSKFGYPFTLQVHRPLAEHDLRLELALHVGDADGPEVDCYRLSPTEFFFAEAVPANAWCLIPRAHLKPRTSYTVTATGPGISAREWSFKTGAK